MDTDQLDSPAALEAPPLPPIAAPGELDDAPPAVDERPPESTPRRPPAPRRSTRRRGRRANPQARRTEKPVLTPRLSCYLRDDGSIDFDRSTDQTIQQLAHAVQQPDARKRLGLEATRPPGDGWATTVPQLVDVVNALGLKFIVMPKFGLTEDEASLFVLRRSPQAHADVCASTTFLLDKYFPGGFGEYDAAIKGVIALVGFVGESVQQLQQLRRDRQPAARPTVVTPFASPDLAAADEG